MVAMSLRITNVDMSSDLSPHWAKWMPGDGWIVSWLPGRVMDRDEAATAMLIAETVATMVGEKAARHNSRSLYLDRLAAELGLSGQEVMTRVLEPPVEDPHDPGPVPWVVEPEVVGRVTTISASPRALVRVTADVGRTGLTGLTVETAAGDSVTVALTAECVDSLLEALAAAVPVPYVPRLPHVDVYIAEPTGGGPRGEQ